MLLGKTRQRVLEEPLVVQLEAQVVLKQQEVVVPKQQEGHLEEDKKEDRNDI